MERIVRRNPGEVIERMLKAIPTEGEDTLRGDLRNAYSTACYQPPESDLPWEMVREAMEARFGAPGHWPTTNLPPWHDRVVDIIQGIEDQP